MINFYVVAMFIGKRLSFGKFDKNHNSKIISLIYILEEKCSGLMCKHETTIWRHDII